MKSSKQNDFRNLVIFICCVLIMATAGGTTKKSIKQVEKQWARFPFVNDSYHLFNASLFSSTTGLPNCTDRLLNYTSCVAKVNETSGNHTDGLKSVSPFEYCSNYDPKRLVDKFWIFKQFVLMRQKKFRCSFYLLLVCEQSSVFLHLAESILVCEKAF